MPIQKTETIWHNGKWINWEDATLHVLSHVVSYGSSVFEGIRCYETRQGPASFRMRDHMQRLVNSGRIYRMEIPYSAEALGAAAHEVVRTNNLNSCYIRPIVMRGYGDMGVNPLKCPLEVYIACWEWGAYLGQEALEQGVDMCISSWSRMAPNTLPAMAKATANYANSALIKMQALADGYSEGIALDVHGNVSEGSGQNIFIVRDGTILTPPISASILGGITRDSIIVLAKELGFTVVEANLPRESLYVADEVFVVGTA